MNQLASDEAELKPGGQRALEKPEKSYFSVCGEKKHPQNHPKSTTYFVFPTVEIFSPIRITQVPG